MNSWSSTVFCKMAHFKQWVHLSAVWEAVLFLCLAGISRLIPKRIREHRWMLNKIQAKRCAPVSLCSGGCLRKLLLAHLERKVGLCGKYSSLSWIFPVVFLSCSHLVQCFHPLPIVWTHELLCLLRMVQCCRGCWWSASFFFHDAFSSSNMLSSALCSLVWEEWVGIQLTNIGLSWRTCHRRLKLKTVVDW